MVNLSKDWLFENGTDPEYKSYLLLAYLQQVSIDFEVQRLYPRLAELVEHYRLLMELKNNTVGLEGLFPRELTGVFAEGLQYRKVVGREQSLEEIKEVIEFALPLLEAHLRSGKDIYDQVERKMHLSAVGLLPVNPDHGYMLINNGNEPETLVYTFNLTVFDQPDGRYRGIRTQYMTGYKRTITTTPEQIKLRLVAEVKAMPNPATLALETDDVIPLEPTLLPVAKRAVTKYLAQISGV